MVVPRDPKVETAVVFPPRTIWLIVRVPAAVTFPDPAGVAHVPSPRQKVELDAEVPLFRLATPKFPVTSADNETAPNDGSPAAFPCNTVVVVPSDPKVADVCDPPPTISWLEVNEAAEVTQVAQPTVPVVVTVPPVSGDENTMEVTVPEPGGAAQVPSPLQNVAEVALVPPFKFPTGRLPVTSVDNATAPKVGAPPEFP